MRINDFDENLKFKRKNFKFVIYNKNSSYYICNVYAVFYIFYKF